MMELGSEWDARIRQTPEADAYYRRIDSWVPPVEELLWRTARASTLVRFFPSSSHNSLRLTTSCDFATAEDVGPCIVYRYDDCTSPERIPDGPLISRRWAVVPEEALGVVPPCARSGTGASCALCPNPLSSAAAGASARR